MSGLLSYFSLLFTASGAAMMIGIWTRWFRPVADNIIVAVLLLFAGLAFALFAFCRGDRSAMCKFSLTFNVLLLVVAGGIALILNASIRGLH